MSESSRLDSWKEIARYLGRDVRTVIRWEQQRGLPVHRIPGGPRPRVYAYPEELRAWLARGSADPDSPLLTPQEVTADAARAEPREFSPDTVGVDDGARASARRGFFGWPMLAVAVGMAIIGLGSLATSWSLTRRVGPAQRLVAAGSELIALDFSDRTVWRYSFTSRELHQPPDRWTHISDLDGDGRQDVLAAINVAHPPLSELDGELVRFSADGKRLWSSSVADRVGFHAGDYGPPWPTAHLATYRIAGQTRIAWAVHHYTWWPALLLTLNAQGERLGTFVNSGWIRSVAQSPDGRHLLAAGVTNSRRAYFVAALDAEHPTGHSPEPPGSTTECVRCPAGNPVRYLVLPRTDVSREQPFPAEGPSVETSGDGMMHVHVRESGPPNTAVTIYTLSPDLDVRQAHFSDAYWEWHRRLEGEGRLHHSAEECPERRGQTVQVWTPEAGWQALRVTVR